MCVEYKYITTFPGNLRDYEHDAYSCHENISWILLLQFLNDYYVYLQVTWQES